MARLHTRHFGGHWTASQLLTTHNGRDVLVANVLCLGEGEEAERRGHECADEIARRYNEHDTLKAENKLLREALEAITETTTSQPATMNDPDWYKHQLYRCIGKAAQALMNAEALRGDTNEPD